ncbi:MAG: UDP-N-acetylmuramate dehydrogenase [Alphaproteobacteria bacterium]|nr:UDP-N-acetylmuramate dehydrogenase [Alphaproteobacteria bacterium]
MVSKLIERLPIVRGRYTQEASLAAMTWFRVGGPAEVVYKPADLEDLCLFLREKPEDIPVHTMGVGSNLLVRDGGVPGVVIRLGKGFNTLVIEGDEIDVGAAVLDRNVALTCCAEALGGLEFLAGIPGTIGGALRMNAGCYGQEIKDILVSALAVDGRGNLHRLSTAECGFSYRHSSVPADWIFICARLKGYKSSVKEIQLRIEKLLVDREVSQPIKTRTGGSTFANPQDRKAWELIDQAGCRGLRHGGAQVSEKHCNFFINTGDATAEDIESLGEEVRMRVRESSGIDLQWEIQRIGERLISATILKEHAA